eukprot:1139077-Pelagomonas_calceolata.AAC.13
MSDLRPCDIECVACKKARPYKARPLPLDKLCSDERHRMLKSRSTAGRKRTYQLQAAGWQTPGRASSVCAARPSSFMHVAKAPGPVSSQCAARPAAAGREPVAWHARQGWPAALP